MQRHDEAAEGCIVFYAASRSKKIDYEGNLRDYLKALGLSGLQERDRDNSPADVVRTLSKRKARYALHMGSIELSLKPKPTNSTAVIAYDIVRTMKRKGAPVGTSTIGQATLVISTGKFTPETDDAVVTRLGDYEQIDEFCKGLYEDFANHDKTINPVAAAWMARKVLAHLGAVPIALNDRAGAAYWMPESGVAKAKEYFDGLAWKFIAVPCEMTEDLSAAISAAEPSKAA